MDLHWTHPLFLLPALSGVSYLLAGLIMLRFPPRKINSWYGYRTPRSMRDTEAWQFAQRYAGRQMVLYGLLLILLGLPGTLVSFGPAIDLILGILLTTLFMSIPIIRTEKELKNRFGK